MRSQAEIMDGLLDQMKMLGSSVRSYVSGNHYEAARISTHVINIVDDTYSKSILTQLGVKLTMGYYSGGGVFLDGNAAADFPLIWIDTVKREHPFIPKFMHPDYERMQEKKLWTFPSWWTDVPIYKSAGWLADKDSQVFTLNRKRLTKAFRNQDGGSHFAEKIADPIYRDMKQLGIGFNWQDGGAPLLGAPQAMMAQIGYELQSSLLTHFPDLPTNI